MLVVSDTGCSLSSAERMSTNNKKVKEAGFVQRPIVRSSPLKRSGMDHTVFRLHSTPHLYLVKHSPDGATTEYTPIVIAAYPKRMKGRVGLVS